MTVLKHYSCKGRIAVCQLKGKILTMYYFLIFVGLQAFCLQNANSQAIHHLQLNDSVTEITAEPVDSLINLPITHVEEPTVNLPQIQSICPQCGHSVDLCDCGCRLAVTVSDSYSSVSNQPNDDLQTVCPQCELSADLCNCGSLPEVVTETAVTNELKNLTIGPHYGLSADLCTASSLPEVITENFTVSNEPKNLTICPHFGLSAELCSCTLTPLVTAAEATTELNQPKSDSDSICPTCGYSIELCKCVSEAVFPETSAVLGEPDIPQSMCPYCDLPVEQCTCEL